MEGLLVLFSLPSKEYTLCSYNQPVAQALCLCYDCGGFMVFYFLPTVTTALVHVTLNLVADLLEYAWSTAYVLFIDYGKKTKLDTELQSSQLTHKR